MQHEWKEEWQALVRYRDEVLERSRHIQDEISAFFRRRQAPPMQLLRGAEMLEGELATIKARLRDFLHQLG
jgi:hypothetical protein